MNDYAHPPQKRDVSLQPLSRDHYLGLVQAQHLTRAADGEPTARRAAVADFLDAWQREIVEHFADEERLLAELLTDEERSRLHEEHRALRDLAGEAKERRRQVDPGDAWCRQLGESLRDHIRWEERELFPAVQARANAEQLAELARHTEPIDRQRGRCTERGET